jgi:hypothetical protein
VIQQEADSITAIDWGETRDCGGNVLRNGGGQRFRERASLSILPYHHYRAKRGRFQEKYLPGGKPGYCEQPGFLEKPGFLYALLSAAQCG